VKALGHPGRCGLLRERSRPARLRPVDAIRCGALSGAHALWISGFDSNRPPSCGVPSESGSVYGLGSPLRCQRARVKFMRQRAVRVAGPDRIIFLRSLLNCLKNQPQRIQSFTKKAPQRTKDRAPHSSVALLRVTLDLCGKAFELAPAASEMPNSICVDLRFLFGLYFFGQPRALS
jgi:hypothetical protein